MLTFIKAINQSIYKKNVTPSKFDSADPQTPRLLSFTLSRAKNSPQQSQEYI